MLLSDTRSSQVGWLVLLGLVALFVFLGLVRLLVFLLFMRLVIDLLVDGLGGRLRFLSRKAVLYAVYILVAGLLVLVATLIVPRFLVELPQYTWTLETNLADKLNGLLGPWNVDVNVGALKGKAAEWAREHLGESFSLARRAVTNVLLLAIALIITFTVTHDQLTARPEDERGAAPGSLWGFLAGFIGQKIETFYGFFRQVMAAQVIISLINAGLTVALLIVLGIPHKIALTVLVFVFGLLPIVGNLISNTIICLSALLWTGPVQVIGALVFLVGIHKLEYVLNGKIIGDRVKLPMYVTLLALLVGESLFHISGMILSIPVVLFVRAELSLVGTGRRPADAGPNRRA